MPPASWPWQAAPCWPRCASRGRAAMRCYRRAHWMVPSRFVPIYEMYNVAEEVGDTATAAALAREILAKPVKVPSRETLEMIEDVRRREAERRR